MIRRETILCVGLFVAALLACKTEDGETTKRGDAGNPRAAGNCCVLVVKQGDVPLFRSIAAYRAWMEVEDEDGDGRELALRHALDNGKLVSSGTPCTYVGTGGGLTQIRVESGSFEGQKFWVRNSWARPGTLDPMGP